MIDEAVWQWSLGPQRNELEIRSESGMIGVAVVGYGLAGRYFHCPLVRRQPRLRLAAVVVRRAETRDEAIATWGRELKGYSSLEEALGDPEIDLVVIATPHDSHAKLAIRTLEAGKHCVVDKVMSLTTEEADSMIAARDRSGRMLSVFHNRRWDWDYATILRLLAEGILGQPRLIESSVCRHAAPRTWRGQAAAAGTILHDWGAHLVDQALMMGLGVCRRLTAWLVEGPWPGVDSFGHGRMVMEFDQVPYTVEVSRMARMERPRWWVEGDQAGFMKLGIDPQEEALRAGNLDGAQELIDHQGWLRRGEELGEIGVPSERPSWDRYYENIALHLEEGAALAVTAEQAREVVRLLEAAVASAREHRLIEGPFGLGQTCPQAASQ